MGKLGHFEPDEVQAHAIVRLCQQILHARSDNSRGTCVRRLGDQGRVGRVGHGTRMYVCQGPYEDEHWL